MNRRSLSYGAAALLILLVVGLGLYAFLPGTYTDQDHPHRRPNILFVLTDDLRWDALGTYGNRSIRTPNMDALAEEGLQLNGMYVASPVCHPSRISFLTGRYRRRISTAAGGSDPTEPPAGTVVSGLNGRGYRTGFVGKAHFGPEPEQLGFDSVPVLLTSGALRSDSGYRYRIHDREQWFERTPMALLVDEAITFLTDDSRRPWFLWFSPSSPHWPYNYYREHPYDPAQIARSPGHPPGFLDRNFDPESELYRRIKRRFPTLRRNYYSNVSALDHHLGRLFEALERSGQADNTFVFLTSDNGIMHFSHGIQGKGVWYEEAARVPGLVRYPPRVEAGAETDALVSSVDFLPTVLELAGGEPPDDREARSVLGLLFEGRAVRNHVYATSRRLKQHGGGTWDMVHDGRHKYAAFRGKNERYLFDLASDPHELSNLADRTELGPVQRRLRAALEGWRRTTQ